MNMRKINVLWCVCFLWGFCLLNEARASVYFPVSKSEKTVVTSRIPEEALKQGGAFFNTLDPRASYRGAVKTFVVKTNVKKSADFKGRIPENPPRIENFASAGRSTSFLVPVAGQISSLFGYRPHPLRRHREFHTGLDLRAPMGTPIHAAAAGVVVFAGWRRGYGLTVEIDHGNGFRTAYAHCSSISTRVGANLGAGTVLGNVGRTGVTTGAHLHLEMKRGNMLLDPLPFLRH